MAMDWIMLAGLSPILMIAPGAWIAFTLFDRTLGPMLRFALAIAFSPFVVGVQVLALTKLGAPFDFAAQLTLLNALAFWLMRPRGKAPASLPAPNIWALLAVFALFVAALLAEWLYEPGLRTYSWHNFQQVAPVYEIARLPEAPEEWDLAGYGVHFSWLGHIQTAVIAKLADTSPFYVHPIANIGALFALLAFLSASVMRFRPQNPIGAVVAAAGAFLSTNLAGILLSYTGNAARIGETRLCTMFYKFFNFDLMTYGIALGAGAMLMAILAAQNPMQRRWLYCACLCALGAAFIYPLMFPVVFALIGAAWVTPKLVTLLESKRLSLTQEDLTVFLALALTGVLFFYNLALLGGEGGLGELSDPAFYKFEIIAIIKTVAAWAPLLALALWHAWRHRDAARTALLLTGGVGAALFVVTHLPTAVEYKFMFAGLMALMPLVADEALGLANRFGRLGAAAGLAAVTLTIAIVAPHFVRDHAPWFGVVTAPEIREDSFIIKPTAPELAWTMAVRDRTPPDTVLVAPPSRMPLSVFTQRAMYAPVDLDEEPYRYGYLLSMRDTVQVKSLPREIVDQRTRLVRSAYAGSSDPTAIAAALTRLERPIAIAGPPDTPLLAWLAAERRGHAIYSDDQTVVWFMPEQHPRD